MAPIASELFRIRTFHSDMVPISDIYHPAAPSGAEAGAASLASLIAEQVERNPDALLDYSPFPPVVAADPAYHFHPGARDAFRGESDPDDETWRDVAEAVLAVRDGQITSWQELDGVVCDVDAASHLERTLNELDTGDLTPRVTAVFAQLARNGTSYNGVKWGIVFGALDEDASVDELLVLLIRHAEFTPYAFGAMETRGGGHGDTAAEEEMPHAAHSDVDGSEPEDEADAPGQAPADDDFYPFSLLHITGGWGIAQLVRSLLEGRVDAAGWRSLVIHGMRNGGPARTTIAALLDTSFDPRSLVEGALAGNDPELALAILRWLVASAFANNLNRQSSWATGAWTQVDNVLALIRRMPPSIETMEALYVLGGTSDLDAIDAGEMSGAHGGAQFLTEKQVATAVNMMEEQISPSLLGEALADPEHRVIALSIIHDLHITELYASVAALCKADPSTLAITTLMVIGNENTAGTLLELLPGPDELAARAAYGMEVEAKRAETAQESEPAGFFDDAEPADDVQPEQEGAAIDGYDDKRFERTTVYGAIITNIGTLGNEEARRWIVTAGADYHPFVRSAALMAMRDLPVELIDEECRQLLRNALEGTEMSLWITADETVQVLGLEDEMGPENG
ncbi:MAG TPA: hypothetical protein VHI13_03740 [Candidatus Kapabacteria bacterium]|nr:hypothetical protein [Candidatus Kapabacteria bacterium]